MRVTLQICLGDTSPLEVSHKLEKLQDVSALARALQRRVADASKIFPALASRKVTAVRVKTEAAERAAYSTPRQTRLRLARPGKVKLE